MRILYAIWIFSFLSLSACVKQPNISQHHYPAHTSHNKSLKATPSFWNFFFLRPFHNDPKSRSGYYSVGGRTYKTLSSAVGYHEKGMASWYGKSFQNSRTSSGEKYNMYARTAAHRTLPLNTYVKVTNVKNGRQVVVRINDRGPFHSTRLIDLSYAAARDLGLFPAGMSFVELQAISSQKSYRPQKTVARKQQTRRVATKKRVTRPVAKPRKAQRHKNTPVLRKRHRSQIHHRAVAKIQLKKQKTNPRKRH